MEFDRKIKDKAKNFNPSCIKDINMNICSTFDSNFKNKKSINDGFEVVTKIKRNFK